MPQKDYYSIIQVRDDAEAIIIEAAYRRLAREYHPDVNKAQNAHQRMVDINEAYQTLSDPSLRKEYDRSRKSTKSDPKEQEQYNSAPQNQKKQSNYQQKSTDNRAFGEPVPPSPKDFGIRADYFDNAVKGANAWKSRKKKIPHNSLIVYRLSYASITILLFYMQIIPLLVCIIIPVVVETLVAYLESENDKKLLSEVYNPRYNPHPDKYAKYAIELAKYESEVKVVYVARSGYRYHNNAFCSSMNMPFEIKKHVAVAKGYTPCSRCGYSSLRPRLLPYPFGSGYNIAPIPDAADSQSSGSSEDSNNSSDSQSYSDSREEKTQSSTAEQTPPESSRKSYSSDKKTTTSSSKKDVITINGDRIQCAKIVSIESKGVQVPFEGVLVSLKTSWGDVGSCIISIEDWVLISAWIIEKLDKLEEIGRVDESEYSLDVMSIKLPKDVVRMTNVGILSIDNIRVIIRVDELKEFAVLLKDD